EIGDDSLGGGVGRPRRLFSPMASGRRAPGELPLRQGAGVTPGGNAIRVDTGNGLEAVAHRTDLGALRVRHGEREHVTGGAELRIGRRAVGTEDPVDLRL